MRTLNFCKKCFEKQRELDRLKEENERLRGELNRRQRKEKEGPFGSSTPSSQKPFKPNTLEEEKKMGGAKPGHKGHGRAGFAPEEADRVEEVPLSFDQCPDCHVLLEGTEAASRSVLDLPPVKPQKVLMTLEKKECPSCHRWFTAKAPGVLPNSLLSNELLTYIVTSHYLYGIPLGRIVKPLRLKIGTVIAALHRLAHLFEGVMPRLTEEYRMAKVKHADETGWRNDGQSGYAWVFCTTQVALFLCRDTRASIVPREVFGEGKIPGVLVVDRYRGYDCIKIKKQYCLEHLKRETEEVQKEFADVEEVQRFCEPFLLLIRKAIRLRSQEIPDAVYYRKARKLKKEIVKMAETEAQHAGIRYLQGIFRDNEASLYRWVEDRDVPADNNFAERTIRLLAIARKVSFGSQSDRGAKTRSILMTVLHTLDLRGIDVSTLFKKALDVIAESPTVDLYDFLFRRGTAPFLMDLQMPGAVPTTSKARSFRIKTKGRGTGKTAGKHQPLRPNGPGVINRHISSGPSPPH